MLTCPCVEAENEVMRRVVSQRRGLGDGAKCLQKIGLPVAGCLHLECYRKEASGTQSHKAMANRIEPPPQAPLSSSPQRSCSTDHFMGKTPARSQLSNRETLVTQGHAVHSH